MQKTEKIQDWMKIHLFTQKGEHSALQMQQKKGKPHEMTAEISFCSVLHLKWAKKLHEDAAKSS